MALKTVASRFNQNYVSENNNNGEVAALPVRLVDVTASQPTSPLSGRNIDQISTPWLSESAKTTLKLVLVILLFLLILAAVPLSILLLPNYAGTLEA